MSAEQKLHDYARETGYLTSIAQALIREAELKDPYARLVYLPSIVHDRCLKEVQTRPPVFFVRNVRTCALAPGTGLSERAKKVLFAIAVSLSPTFCSILEDPDLLGGNAVDQLVDVRQSQLGNFRINDPLHVHDPTRRDDEIGFSELVDAGIVQPGDATVSGRDAFEGGAYPVSVAHHIAAAMIEQSMHIAKHGGRAVVVHANDSASISLLNGVDRSVKGNMTPATFEDDIAAAAFRGKQRQEERRALVEIGNELDFTSEQIAQLWIRKGVADNDDDVVDVSRQVKRYRGIIRREASG